MLASEFYTNKLSTWHICTLFLIFPLLCVQISSAPFSIISYRFSIVPHTCLMAFYLCSFEINLYQADLSRPGNNGTVATECSAAGWQAFAKLWAQTLYTHTHRAVTLIRSHGITELQEKKWEKQVYLFSGDPATAKGSLLTSKWNIFSTASVDRWGCVLWILDAVVLFLLDFLVSIIKGTQIYHKDEGREKDWVPDWN